MLRFESIGRAAEKGYFQSRAATQVGPLGDETILLSVSAMNGQVFDAEYPSQAMADLWGEHPFFAAPWHGLTDPAENEPFEVIAA